jgi:hypothetical protein
LASAERKRKICDKDRCHHGGLSSMIPVHDDVMLG